MEALDSSLTSVTIYRQGALVCRTIELPQGATDTLEIRGLPLAMSDHGLAVEVLGPEPRPSIMDYRVTLRANGVEKLGEQDHALRKASQEKETISAELDALRRLRACLETLHPAARPRGSEGAPLGEFRIEGPLSLLKFRQGKLQALEEKIAKTEVAYQEAERVVEKLQHQATLAAPESQPGQLEKSVILRLRGEVASKTQIKLSYPIPGARWVPAYSIDFSDSFEHAILTMRAMVSQKTGEDWTSVPMTLSTANPSEWRDIPRWRSLRIGRQQEPQAPAWFPPPPDTERLFSDFDRATSQATPQTIEAVPMKKLSPMKERARPTVFDDEEGGHYSECAAPAPVQAAPPPPPPPPGHVAQNLSPLGGAMESVRFRAAGGASLKDSLGFGSRPSRQILDYQFLQYRSLRLQNAMSAQRGQLVPLNWRQEYLESSSSDLSESALARALNARVEARAVESSPPPSGHSTYPSSLSGFDYSYPGQAPVDIPSDGRFHSVPVFVLELSTRLEHICVPRSSHDVFRSAVITNPSERALPEGPIDVNVAGAFLHTTGLKAVTPKSEFRLGLGVDQAVKVRRNSKFKEGTSGLMGGTTELVHNVELEAVNHRTTPTTLEIRERLPQPAPESKEELKVHLLSVKPDWEKYSPPDEPFLEQAYRWKLKLAPGEKVEAHFRYMIEMSSKLELRGGNRREPQS